MTNKSSPLSQSLSRLGHISLNDLYVNNANFVDAWAKKQIKSRANEKTRRVNDATSASTSSSASESISGGPSAINPDPDSHAWRCVANVKSAQMAVTGVRPTKRVSWSVHPVQFTSSHDIHAESGPLRRRRWMVEVEELRVNQSGGRWPG